MWCTVRKTSGTLRLVIFCLRNASALFSTLSWSGLKVSCGGWVELVSDNIEQIIPLLGKLIPWDLLCSLLDCQTVNYIKWLEEKQQIDFLKLLSSRVATILFWLKRLSCLRLWSFNQGNALTPNKLHCP